MWSSDADTTPTKDEICNMKVYAVPTIHIHPSLFHTLRNVSDEARIS